jgi:hypothetical protein
MKKILFLFLLLSLPAAGIFFYYNRVSSNTLNEEQKKKATEKILGRAVREEKTTALGTHDGQYFSFSYPAWVRVDTRDAETVKKNPAVLELFELRDPETHLFIVVQATRAGISRLSDESSVRLRLDRTDVYKQSTVTISGHEGFLFEKTTDGAEKSVFILADGKLYTIAASALSMVRIDEVLPQIVKTMEIK